MIHQLSGLQIITLVFLFVRDSHFFKKKKIATVRESKTFQRGGWQKSGTQFLVYHVLLYFDYSTRGALYSHMDLLEDIK